MEMVVDKASVRNKGGRLFAEARGVDRPVLSDDLKRHFRESFPVLLDGALSPSPISGFLLRQARQSLSRRSGDPHIMSSAILREALESVVATANPSTKAGLVAIAPKRARVWWDPAAIENLDDVIAGLTRPRPVLRFFDVTGIDPKAGRWNNVFDIDIDIAEKGRTVDFWAADRSYIVELGFVHADGIFLGLARTNLAALPREGRGDAANAVVGRSNLPSRASGVRPDIIPDRSARDWADARPDHHRRDLEAELIIHMLYKAFLASGPRALRAAPAVYPRDSGVLRQEYIQRGRRRDRQRQAFCSPDAPQLLIADLGAAASANDGERPMYLPAPFGVAPFRLVLPGLSAREFAYYRDLTAASMTGRVYRPVPADLVQPAPSRAKQPFSPMAAPVFEAAERLRKQLSRISAAPSEPVSRRKAGAGIVRTVAGDAGRRLDRAGVRVTRMALMLEGRMRPGARLRVAGKVVKADADGRFKLECTLSETKNSLPVRVNSRSGELRSLINVDWAKAPQKRKTVLVH